MRPSACKADRDWRSDSFNSSSGDGQDVAPIEGEGADPNAVGGWN